ncbi:DUF6192 family protein [Streptomyces sviceus]|uniref:DUF6192 family protein n=1 Tax=Streptomyces sviceus TaxID=285530 RepID=UPI00331F7B17
MTAWDTTLASRLLTTNPARRASSLVLPPSAAASSTAALLHPSRPGSASSRAKLTRDDEVAAQVATDLLKRPAVTEHVTPAERVRVVTELTRDDIVAQQVTTGLLRRPAVARKTMRDDTARMLVNRAQFDNSNETRDRIRERTPAVRAIEHTIEYLDLVGSCHGFVATLGRLVPQLRGQEFTEDERETVRRQIGRVRAAADWLEGALDNG